MMLAAPEFVIPEPVELLDEVEIAAELQQRMLAHGVMRGKKGAELQAGHIRTPFVAAATGNWRTSYQNSSLRFLQLQRRDGYDQFWMNLNFRRNTTQSGVGVRNRNWTRELR